MKIKDLPNPPENWSDETMNRITKYYEQKYSTYAMVEYILNIALKEEPKPCPFCGSTNLNQPNKFEIIRCMNCRATGPTYYIHANKQDHISLWNERS